MRDNKFTKILNWPGYRVFRHEIDETAMTLRLWVRRKRGNRKLICSYCKSEDIRFAIGKSSLTRTHRAESRHYNFDVHDLTAAQRLKAQPALSTLQRSV